MEIDQIGSTVGLYLLSYPNTSEKVLELKLTVATKCEELQLAIIAYQEQLLKDLQDNDTNI